MYNMSTKEIQSIFEKKLQWLDLTEVTGEGGPDLAPQKFYCPNSLDTS